MTGAVEWVVLGGGRDLDAATALEHLKEQSTDPAVLGEVLGVYLVRAEELSSLAVAADLLRAAGADEDAAGVKASWLRERYPRGLV